MMPVHAFGQLPPSWHALIMKEIVTAKPCSVCAVCGLSGGRYREYFCSGLAMVIAVNVGHIWEWPRLSCLRLAHFRNLPGGGGKRGPTRVANFVLPTYSLRREVVGEGALRGRSPRTREGRIGPTARNCSGQWSVVSGQ